MNLNPKVARRQAEICVGLIRELDRAVTEEKQPADQYLAHFYRQHREYGARDRRFLSDAVFSWFRWRGWLKTPEKENIAAAILLDADEVPPQLEYLGLNLSNNALKPLGPLMLEEKAEYLRSRLNTPSLQTDELEYCSLVGRTLRVSRSYRRLGRDASPYLLKFMCSELAPPWFPDCVFIPPGKNRALHLRQCIESFQSRPPTWLRLPSENTSRFISMLSTAGLEVAKHAAIKEAAFIKGGKGFDSGRFPQIQIQDLASQCVGLCCDPKPGGHWWDMCAGAGGKSLHLADLMQDKGNILATDIRPEILNQLARRIKNIPCRSDKMQKQTRNPPRSANRPFGLAQGGRTTPPPEGNIQKDPLLGGVRDLSRRCGFAKGDAGGGSGGNRKEDCLIHPVLWDGKCDPIPGKYFDGVLIDAPCSGTGAWHRNPDARWRTDAGQITVYAGIQKNLLEMAAGKIRPGGKLIYSTCTLTKIENSGVIQDFLDHHREFRLDTTLNPLTHAPSTGIIYLWPWEGNCNGMFVAVMKKGVTKRVDLPAKPV